MSTNHRAHAFIEVVAAHDAGDDPEFRTHTVVEIEAASSRICSNAILRLVGDLARMAAAGISQRPHPRPLSAPRAGDCPEPLRRSRPEKPGRSLPPGQPAEWARERAERRQRTETSTPSDNAWGSSGNRELGTRCVAKPTDAFARTEPAPRSGRDRFRSGPQASAGNRSHPHPGRSRSTTSGMANK